MNESVVDSRSYNHVRVYKAVVGSQKNKYFLSKRCQEVRHVLPFDIQSRHNAKSMGYMTRLFAQSVLGGDLHRLEHLIRVMHVSILITSLN